MKRLLIISCYDSFLKASFNVARIFKNNQYRIEYFIYSDYRELDLNHFREIGFDYTYNSGWLKDLFRNDEVFEFDAIMLSMEGPAIHKFYQLFSKRIAELNPARRPVLFAGYVGIVYENFMQGFMDRQPVDVFYVNCKHDLQLFKEYCKKLNLPSDNIVLTGLPMLDTAYRLKPTIRRENNALLFAGQPTVPKSLSERIHIIKKLIEYAGAHPNEKIYFKPRHKPNQSTFHIVMFHYEDIFRYLGKKIRIPSNFVLTYEPILELLKRVNLCLTVSSTATFESICMGIPVGFVADFGISEKYGNYYFADSGCLTTLGQIALNNTDTMNSDWLEEYFCCDGKNTNRVFAAVDSLVEDQKLNSNVLPLKRYFKGELIGNESIQTVTKQNKSDFINKLTYRAIIKAFRLLSKVSPAIYFRLLS